MSTLNKTKLKVTELNYSKTRIDKWVSAQIPELSRSHVVHLIDKAAITVNQKTVKSSYEIVRGDEIDIVIPEVQSSGILPADIN